MTRTGGRPIPRRSVLEGLAGAGVLSGLGSAAAGRSGGREQVFVRVGGSDPPWRATASVAALRRGARRSQAGVAEWARSTPGASVSRQFWLVDGLLVEYDPDRVSPADLAARDDVRDLHPNFGVSIPDPTPAATDRTTYGLDQVGVPEAWERFDTRGAGSTVAVIDTGVDPDHPDIDIAAGNFAEFDPSGERRPDAEPRDTSYHGTHVSGTAVGGDASGEHIGVAPDATLLHGVGLPGGGGSFAQVVGAMEWAVENGADVLNLSLGVPGFLGRLIEPVRNAERAGAVVVSSSGNTGVGTTGSPGNVFEALSVGATDAEESVADFSSGAVVDTGETWGSQAPAGWPDSYVVPDVVAPGVAVKSAVPPGADLPGPIERVGEGYALLDGTSMASPHVAGLVALLVASAREAYTPAQFRRAVTTTARAPPEAPSDPDPRFGRGIADALAAVGRVGAASGVTGTVTGPDGSPVTGATVELGGFSTETDGEGTYRLRALDGEYDVRAGGFGFAAETATVEVAGGFETVDFELAPALAAAATTPQPEGVEAGEDFETGIELANADALTVEVVGDYEGQTVLVVDGDQFPEGRRVPLDGPVTGEVDVRVLTTEGASGELELRYTVEGLGDTVEVRTGPTVVFPDPIPVGVVDVADSAAGEDVAVRLDRVLDPRYRFSVVEASEVLSAVEADDYEAYVVQDFPDDDTLVESFIERTRSPSVGVVYLEQFGETCNAISRLSAATGDPTGVRDGAVELSRPAASPGVQYDVEADHPVLAGVSGRVPLYTPERSLFFGGFHSSFEGYDGVVDGRRIATTQVDFVDSGGGIGVDDLTRTVLAASLGQSAFVTRDDFTTDADRILGNAVEFAAETPPVVVADTEARRIDPGGSTTVLTSVRDLTEYTVSLTSDSTLDRDELTLSLDGDPVAPGQSVTFEDPVTGELPVTVETDADAVGRVSLAHEFVTRDDDGETTTTEVTTGPTSVYVPPVEVPADEGTIQAGVDLVAPGGEVVVADGTYEESAPRRGFQTGVYVGTRGVTLRAADGANPVVLHPKDLPSPSIVTVAAADVTVEGLTLNVVDGGVDPKNAVGFGLRVRRATTGTTVRGVTAGGTNAVFLGPSVSGVLVEDVTAVDTGIAVGTDIGGGPVEGVTVRNLTAQSPADVGWGGVYVENATGVTVTDSLLVYGELYNAGVFVHGPFGGGGDCRVANNRIVGPAADGDLERTDIGVYLDRVGTVVEGNDVRAARVGVRLGQGGFGRRNVLVRNNDLQARERGCLQVGEFSTVEGNAVDAAVGIDFDGGFSGLPADGVLARFNDLSGTDRPLVGTPSLGADAPEGPFDARLNYFGDRGYDDTIADGEFAYDPFLTAPPGSVDREAPTAIATDLRLAAGETYGLGIPGPTDRTIRELLTRGGATSFEGTVETRDPDAEAWTDADPDRTLSALSALRITPETNLRAVLDFQSDGDGGGGDAGDGDGDGDDDGLPTRTLQSGTNVVPAPRYGRAGIFEESSATVESVDSRALSAPASQLGPTDAERSAFEAYHVEVSDPGTLRADLAGTDPVPSTLLQSLGLDPTIHDDPGVGTRKRRRSATPSVSVEEVLATADDDAAAADALTDLLGARLADAVERTDATTVDAVESVLTAAVGDRLDRAPVRTAVRRVFRQALGAAVIDGEEVPTVVERHRERRDGAR